MKFKFVCLALLGCAVLSPTVWVANAQEDEVAPAVVTPAKVDRVSQSHEYLTMADREKAAVEAALTDLDSVKKSSSPMVCWTAQLLYKSGRVQEANDLVRSYVERLIQVAKGRIAGMEKAKKAGTWKSLPVGNGQLWGEPHVNGFGLWGVLNVYVHYQDKMDKQLQEDIRWICTKNTSWAGSTGNLSFLIPFNLYLTDKLWGPDALPKDGRYGARGEGAVKMFYKRMDYTVSRGSPEFASRPYMMYNVGTLLSLDKPFIDPEIAKRARMAYEMSLAHAAGSWLKGNWVTPAGRSYPAYVTQAPGGSAGMLWTYFGGCAPRLNGMSPVLFTAAESWRPPALIINAATNRSKPYVHRSRFDGIHHFQTAYINRTYGVFSTALTHPPTGRKSSIWGQCYPYGVMFDQPDTTKASICWMTVPCFDDKPLTDWTQGVNSGFCEYLQREGTLLLVANDLCNPANLPKIRQDIKGHQQFSLTTRSILGYVPDGYQALIDDAAKDGRIFLDYGSVLIAFSASQPFTWKPQSGTFSGGSPSKKDSEFRIPAENAVLAMETASPDEFPGLTLEKRLAVFKATIINKSKITLGSDLLPPPSPEKPAKNRAAKPEGPRLVAKGTYVDRFGHILEKTFQGSAKIDGKEVDYESWPLVDNPWVHQDWDGNMRVTDGVIERLYDVKNWIITEHPVMH